jgi:dephospho-CoA kinase
VKRLVVERWGERVLDAAGEVDRRAVGGIVFGDEDELAWLESILHPRTVEAQRRFRDELGDGVRLVAIEVPLLYETGAESRFDAVVVVTAPPETRAARKQVDHLEERQRRLLPDEEKLARADFAYVNDGTLEELDAFVAGVVERLT